MRIECTVMVSSSVVDPDPSLFLRIRILPSSNKKRRKTLIFGTVFCDFFMTFMKNDKNVPSKSKKAKNSKTYFSFASRKPLAKKTGSGSVS
jgi:hypothetical protein